MRRSLFTALFLALLTLFGSAAAQPPLEIVSVMPDGEPGEESSAVGGVSDSGRYVVIGSGSELDPADDSDYGDVFVRDVEEEETVLVSVSSDGDQGEGNASWSRISGDGKTVAFLTYARLTSDAPDTKHLYVHDMDSGKTKLASVNSQGEPSNDIISELELSGDGRYVVFTTGATNLVPHDTNEMRDIFMRDLQEGKTTRVSIGRRYRQSPGNSGWPSVSRRGRFVAFVSGAFLNSRNTDARGMQAFVRDRKKGITEMVSLNNSGRPANENISEVDISGNGRFVAFTTDASNLFPNDDNEAYNIFVHDRRTDRTERVSIHDQLTGVDNDSLQPTISDDGRYVTFASEAKILEDDSDPQSSTSDIFVFDRKTEETIALTARDECPCGWPFISGDGNHVGFFGDYQAYLSGPLH